MSKDSLIVILLLAVVIAAGVTFFIFSQDEGPDTFQPGPSGLDKLVEDGGRKNAAPVRTPNEVLNEFKPKDWTKEAGPSVTAEPELVADLAAKLYGKVVNPDGEPLPGSVVALCVDIGNSRAHSVIGEVAAVATTDVDGGYIISNIAADDRYVVRVEAAEFAPKIENVLQFKGGENRHFDFVLQEGLELTGVVLDQEDRPIPGAQILVFDQASRAQDPNMDVEKACMTDANGEYLCKGLNPGMKRVTAQAEGFGTETDLSVQIFDGMETKPANFKLAPGGVTFVGRVVDAYDELPIRSCLVRAQPISTGRRNMPSWNYPPVATDDDGHFTFIGLMPGSYRFKAFGPQGYPSAGAEITAIVPRTENAVIKLESGPSVVGRVVDALTGEPIDRFKISFSFGEHNVMNAPALTQRFTDPKGEFEYRGIQVSPQKKEFWLHAVAKGYAGGTSPKQITDGKSDIEGVVIEMYRGATAIGKVIDGDGNPIRGAEVELSPQLGAPGDPNQNIFGALISNGMRSESRRTGVTDDKGEYRIETIPAGWFKVSVNHANFADTESEQHYEFGREGSLDLGTISLMKGAKVRGRVLDKDGNAEQGAKVQLRAKAGISGQSYIKMADSAGHFEFSNVRPGIYVVTVTERKGQPDFGGMFSAALAGGMAQEEIIIGDGEAKDVGDLRP